MFNVYCSIISSVMTRDSCALNIYYYLMLGSKRKEFENEWERRDRRKNEFSMVKMEQLTWM